MNSKVYTKKQSELLRLFKNGGLRRLNILEGSVRSGKTWISLVLWTLWVRSMPESGSFLMAAKTLYSLKRNALEPLEELVGTSNLQYSIGKKEGRLFGRRLYFEGVSDARAEGRIRGMTLTGAYCDELTLFTQEFFAMLLSRLSNAGAKLIATTNPDAPTHWLMRDYLSRAASLDLLRVTFGIDDNTFLDAEYVKRLKAEYSGVHYERFILGRWTAAEGVIFPAFANEPERFTAKEKPKQLEFISIGVDYGGNRSKTMFVAVGILRGYRGVCVLSEHRVEGAKGEIEPVRVFAEFVAFAKQVAKENAGCAVRYAFGDCAEQYLNTGLRAAVNADGELCGTLKVGDSKKRPILERIRCKNALLGLDAWSVMESCEKVIQSTRTVRWDAKSAKDARLDDGSTDVDTADAEEYAWERFIERLGAGAAAERRERE